jgi:hypothetical protein
MFFTPQGIKAADHTEINHLMQLDPHEHVASDKQDDAQDCTTHPLTVP